MTLIYSALFFWFYWRTGKKDPTSRLFGKGKGGKGKGGAAAGDGGGGTGGKKTPQKVWKNVRAVVLFAAVVLLLAGAALFGYSSIGAMVTDPLMWIFDLIMGWFGLPGVVLSTVLFLIAVGTVIIDVLADFDIDKPAKNALLATPLLAICSAGPIAAFWQNFNLWVQVNAAATVAWMF